MPRRKKEDELPPDQRGPPRGAANLRERTRMRVLSKAFGKLKLMLPWVPPDTKLSKLDTLRLATSYISHLQRILDEEDNPGDGSSISDGAKLTLGFTPNQTNLGCWPYGHHRLLNQQNQLSASIKSAKIPSSEELQSANSSATSDDENVAVTNDIYRPNNVVTHVTSVTGSNESCNGSYDVTSRPMDSPMSFSF